MHGVESKMVDNYINNVCGLIKNKRVHKNIKEELLDHIEEIIEDSIEGGKSEEEAINYALEQMGAFDVVGSSLNKVHKAAPDWILIAMTSILISFGVLTLVIMNKGGELPIGGPIIRIGLCFT
ncbi:MAG: permease prefix domain 1-containing protein, partial [Clostridium sp.]